MTSESKVKVKYTHSKKTCATACNANSSFIFKWIVFILSTMIAYDV